MVWVWFSGRLGKGGLYFLPPNTTTMNSVHFKAVLENHLFPFMELHTKWFLQDCAPCQKRKVVMGRLKDIQ
jgi:hypothetical protein